MKQYLGDAVYFEFDRYANIVLTTENGVDVTNRIVLEPRVYESLLNVVNQLRKKST